MTAGRPTDYTPDILEKTKAYLEKYKDDGDAFPQVASLSRKLNVSRTTVYLWAKQYPEFSNMLEDVLSEQERVILNKGIIGEFNPPIAKLVLHKHGYSDKIETDITSKGGQIFTSVKEKSDAELEELARSTTGTSEARVSP